MARSADDCMAKGAQNASTKLIAIVYRIRDRASSRLLFGEDEIPEIVAAPKARLREPAGTGTRAVSVRLKISSQMNVNSTDGRPGALV
mmetsp:Transcript_3035/g.9010  ORF Transcript_3035/g.9010 Transcript_3035/m.9010 type:complete len:88 (+) Transcript_3035:1628-1891(+)